MTALIGFVSRQFTRTTRSPRRLRVMMALLVFIAGAGIVLMLQRYPAAQAVQYKTQQTIVPVPAELCPGEAFTYQQSIAVQQTAMVTISRDWCNRGFTCHLELHQSWPNVVLTPHIGGATWDTEANHSALIASGLVELFAGGRPSNLVNPEVLDR